MRSHNTLACVGLDPDLKKMPLEILRRDISDEEKVLMFLEGVVDYTAQHVCAYKAQKAFFDKLSGGHQVLKELVAYIHVAHPEIPLIVDCKVGDIDNTMEAYMENLFGKLNADGIVVNPYMGDDVLLPLMKLRDKAIVVLVKTSNPAGSIVQDVVLESGKPLWRYMLELVINRWGRNQNMIPVLSATAGLDVAPLRTIIPDEMPILLAGVGAQGGGCESLRGLLNSEGIGVFVNSSRAVLYPPQSRQPWQKAIEEAAIELKDVLNKARGGKT